METLKLNRSRLNRFGIKVYTPKQKRTAILFLSSISLIEQNGCVEECDSIYGDIVYINNNNKFINSHTQGDHLDKVFDSKDINTIENIYNYLYNEEIVVGEYKVEFQKDSIKVGCQTVTKETLVKILDKLNKQ
jgi:hypothetical protein